MKSQPLKTLTFRDVFKMSEQAKVSSGKDKPSKPKKQEKLIEFGLLPQGNSSKASISQSGKVEDKPAKLEFEAVAVSASKSQLPNNMNQSDKSKKSSSSQPKNNAASAQGKGAQKHSRNRKRWTFHQKRRFCLQIFHGCAYTGKFCANLC